MLQRDCPCFGIAGGEAFKHSVPVNGEKWGRGAEGFREGWSVASEMGEFAEIGMLDCQELGLNAQGLCKSSTLCKSCDYLIPQAIPWAGACVHSRDSPV